MKKYPLLLIAMAFCAAAGVWAYIALKGSVPGGEASAAAEQVAGRVYEAGPDGRPAEAAKAMVMKAAMGAVPKPEKSYKLSGEIEQEDLLRTLLDAVSGNTAVSELKQADWDMDWREDADRRATKTFYRDSANREKISLDAYLTGPVGNYREAVLRGSLRVCTNPSQGDLLETLRKEGFEVKSPTAPVHGFGSAYWRSVFELRRGGLSGLTYYVVPTGVTGCLELSLRDGKVADSLPLKEFSFSALFPLVLPPELLADLESGGAAKLVPDWEGMNKIAVSTGVLYARDLEVLAKAYAGISASAAVGEQGAAIGVLKSHLIMQLFWRGSYYETNPNEGGGGKPFRQIMDENGIKYYESHYGGVFPEKQFKIDIYEKSPSSYWGQYAFLRHLAGAPGGEDFNYGLQTDQPIKLGGEFLKDYPDSPFYSDVLFLVGRAYETLYNQGFTAGGCDRYAGKDCSELAAAQEKNREKTLDIFAAVLAAPGGAKYKEFIDTIVPRLKVRGKTYCYDYFPRSD